MRQPADHARQVTWFSRRLPVRVFFARRSSRRGKRSVELIDIPFLQKEGLEGHRIRPRTDLELTTLVIKEGDTRSSLVRHAAAKFQNVPDDFRRRYA